MSNCLNTNELEAFNQFVRQQKNSILREYTRGINKDLARQNPSKLMQRNVLLILEQTYAQTMQHLNSLKSEPMTTSNESESSKLANELLNAFDGLVDEFLPAVIKHHRSSCALSNFPEEHNPSAEYIAQVIQATEQQWNDYVAAVNQFVVNKITNIKN